MTQDTEKSMPINLIMHAETKVDFVPSALGDRYKTMIGAETDHVAATLWLAPMLMAAVLNFLAKPMDDFNSGEDELRSWAYTVCAGLSPQGLDLVKRMGRMAAL